MYIQRNKVKSKSGKQVEVFVCQKLLWKVRVTTQKGKTRYNPE